MVVKGEKKKSGGKRGAKLNAGDLSIKERKFCAEYVLDENGTRSAIAAGYAEQSAAVTASRLLKKAKILAEIERNAKTELDKLAITKENVLRGLAILANYDVRKMFDDDGRIKPVSELDDETALAITSISTVHKVVGEEKDGCVVFTDIKFADRGKNLERLGRHLKLFTDKVEHGGRLTLEQLVVGDE